MSVVDDMLDAAVEALLPAVTDPLTAQMSEAQYARFLAMHAVPAVLAVLVPLLAANPSRH